MTIKKELMALKKDITAMGKKMEKLITAFEKSEKATVTRPSKPKAVKAKPAKKAPIAPAKKKTVQVTATDQVLKIINRSKKGVDIATLIKKTGFNRKKVTNILQRSFKAGKIKRADTGIYVGVK
jgi:hypothetical protein